MADPQIPFDAPHRSGAAGKNVVKELRRVDDAFSMLRPGRELDDKLFELIDADPVARPRALSPGRALAGLGATAVVCALAAVLLSPKSEDSSLALRSPDMPVPAAAPIEPTAASEAGQPMAPATSRPASAPRAASDASRIAVLRPEEVRFVEVPLGRLELHAPAVVDVKDDGVAIVAGTARLLERGQAPRTLLAGESIGWQVQTSRQAPAPVTRATAHRSAPTVGDDEVQAVLEQARGLQARGEPAAAADLLGDLLARPLSPRIADTIAFERAALLVRARDVPDACAVYAEHARRFPSSENSADVAAARIRLACP